MAVGPYTQERMKARFLESHTRICNGNWLRMIACSFVLWSFVADCPSHHVTWRFGRTSLNGATVSTALVQLDSYVNGMAAVVSVLV